MGAYFDKDAPLPGQVLHTHQDGQCCLFSESLLCRMMHVLPCNAAFNHHGFLTVILCSTFLFSQHAGSLTHIFFPTLKESRWDLFLWTCIELEERWHFCFEGSSPGMCRFFPFTQTFLPFSNT